MEFTGHHVPYNPFCVTNNHLQVSLSGLEGKVHLHHTGVHHSTRPNRSECSERGDCIEEQLSFKINTLPSSLLLSASQSPLQMKYGTGASDISPFEATQEMHFLA